MNLSLAPVVTCCPIPSSALLSWDFLHSLTPNEVYNFCSTLLYSGAFSPSGFFSLWFAIGTFIVLADLRISASKPTSAWHVISCMKGLLTVLLLFLFSCKFLRLFSSFPLFQIPGNAPHQADRSWYLCAKSERTSTLHLCICLEPHFHLHCCTYASPWSSTSLCIAASLHPPWSSVSICVSLDTLSYFFIINFFHLGSGGTRL